MPIKRKVIYPLVKNGHEIIKPYAGEYSNTEFDAVNENLLISDYIGLATEAELPTYVAPSRPEIIIVSIDCNDPSFFFDILPKVGACVTKALVVIIDLYKKVLEIKKRS